MIQSADIDVIGVDAWHCDIEWAWQFVKRLIGIQREKTNIYFDLWHSGWWGPNRVRIYDDPQCSCRMGSCHKHTASIGQHEFELHVDWLGKLFWICLRPILLLFFTQIDVRHVQGLIVGTGAKLQPRYTGKINKMDIFWCFGADYCIERSNAQCYSYLKCPFHFLCMLPPTYGASIKSPCAQHHNITHIVAHYMWIDSDLTLSTADINLCYRSISAQRRSMCVAWISSISAYVCRLIDGCFALLLNGGHSYDLRQLRLLPAYYINIAVTMRWQWISYFVADITGRRYRHRCNEKLLSDFLLDAQVKNLNRFRLWQSREENLNSQFRSCMHLQRQRRWRRMWRRLRHQQKTCQFSFGSTIWLRLFTVGENGLGSCVSVCFWLLLFRIELVSILKVIRVRIRSRLSLNWNANEMQSSFLSIRTRFHFPAKGVNDSTVLKWRQFNDETTKFEKRNTSWKDPIGACVCVRSSSDTIQTESTVMISRWRAIRQKICSHIVQRSTPFRVIS